MTHKERVDLPKNRKAVSTRMGAIGVFTLMAYA